MQDWPVFSGYTSHFEGWGLYSEFLGLEMGMFQNPYHKIGFYTIRLVSTLEVYYELQDWSLTLASMPLAGVGIGQLNICLTILDFQNQ